MISFTRDDIHFIRRCCSLYADDGCCSPDPFPIMDTDSQREYISAALTKISSVLLNQPLTQMEAMVLCMAITYAVNTYPTTYDPAKLKRLYNGLADIFDPETSS